MNPFHVARILTLSGVLPFVFLEIAIALNLSQLDFHLALISYAAVIISFISGMHWATFLFFTHQRLPNLFIQSNVVTLIGWASIFMNRYPITLGVQLICFIYLLKLDLNLYQQGIIPKWFFDLRISASILVVTLLAIGVWI